MISCESENARLWKCDCSLNVYAVFPRAYLYEEIHLNLPDPGLRGEIPPSRGILCIFISRVQLDSIIYLYNPLAT